MTVWTRTNAPGPRKGARRPARAPEAPGMSPDPFRRPQRVRKGPRLPQRESPIQISVANHLRMLGPLDALFWHTPNEVGGRSIAEAARLKAEGVLAGVSDVLVFWRGRFYALELKTDTGTLEPAQRAFLNDVIRNGGFAAVAYGVDAALAQLRAWGLLPPANVGRRAGGEA